MFMAWCVFEDMGIPSSGHFADLDFWKKCCGWDPEPDSPKKNSGETRLFLVKKWALLIYWNERILISGEKNTQCDKTWRFFPGSLWGSKSQRKQPGCDKMVSFGDVHAQAVERILSHPLMSLCPMHIYLENPGEFSEEWQVFFLAFRHQLDVKFLLGWNPERFQMWTEKQDFAKIQRCCAKSCFLTRQVAVLHGFSLELYLILPLLHSFWHTLTYLDNILMVDEKQRWITDDKKKHQFGRSN